jgi:hypothetical protein
MDGKRRPSQDREQSRRRAAPAPSAEPAATAARTERFGPLEVTRLRKEDGRALIVYSRTTPADRPEATREPERS